MLLEIPQYTTMLERLAVTLRPGGLLVLVEGEPTYVSGTGTTAVGLLDDAVPLVIDRGSAQSGLTDMEHLCKGGIW